MSLLEERQDLLVNIKRTETRMRDLLQEARNADSLMLIDVLRKEIELLARKQSRRRERIREIDRRMSLEGAWDPIKGEFGKKMSWSPQ